MTQEYTPTTEQIEDAWVSRYDGEHTSASSNEACVYYAQFDRWLAEHDSKVFKQGVAAHSEICDGFYGTVTNPYTGLETDGVDDDNIPMRAAFEAVYKSRERES